MYIPFTRYWLLRLKQSRKMAGTCSRRGRDESLKTWMDVTALGDFGAGRSKVKSKHSGLLSVWSLLVVQYSTEHNVSETRSVSVFRWGGGRHLLCWIRCKELTSFTGGNTSGFRNAVFFRIPDDGQSPKPSNSEFYTTSLEPFRIYLKK
jgi:hypothetical protein